MSVPRLRRTVALAPNCSRRSRNSSTRLADEPVVGYPGVGLSGIRLTWPWGLSRRHSAASSRASLFAVVDALDHRPLETDPTVLDLQIVVAGLHQILDRITAVDGDQFVTQCVVGGVERNGEVDRQGSILQRSDAGDDADRRNRDVPRGQPEVGMESFGGCPHRIEVGHRLAHAHEHDVADPPLELLAR